MSEAEDRVRALNKLRAKAKGLEDGMRSLRLGAGVELRFKEVWWRSMGYGGGWFHQKAEPLPEGTSAEFYDFLSKKAEKVGAKIREAEKSLDALTPTRPEGAESEQEL